MTQGKRRVQELLARYDLVPRRAFGQHFLADPEEIKEAREEGIAIHDARGPQQIVIEDGTLRGLRTWKVMSIFDEQGRFAPKYDESDRQVHEGEAIIEAIGQMTDTDLLGEELTEALALSAPLLTM